MRVLLVGGGSGGHVTPLKAIAEVLRSEATDAQITVVTDRGFYAETEAIFAGDTDIRLRRIFSGKYRRYSNKSFLWHIVHLPTLLKNIRDVVLLGIGFMQAVGYFLLHRPDVVFCKGGFVCVPVGIVAQLFRVPIIIHDSDTRPGLTNRILAKYARVIATGMPAGFYPYDPQKMAYTGIPVSAQYQPVSQKEKEEHKTSVGFDPARPLLLVTGGGNGSTPLNTQLQMIAGQLISAGWCIMQLAGRGKIEPVQRVRSKLPQSQQKHWQILEFAPMPPRLLGADVVVCRTSASTIQECANSQKTVIGIASPSLEDQKMNADFFASKKALVSLDETKLSPDGLDLLAVVTDLHANLKLAQEYAHALHRQFAKPEAAQELAQLILEAGSSS